MLRMIWIGVALALSVPASAADWRVAGGNNTSSGRLVIFVDAASVKRDGDKVYYKTLTLLERAPRPDTWDRMDASRQGVCSKQAMGLLDYRSSNQGKVLADEKRELYLTTAKDRAQVEALQSACKQRDWASETVADPEPWTRAYWARGAGNPGKEPKPAGSGLNAVWGIDLAQYLDGRWYEQPNCKGFVEFSDSVDSYRRWDGKTGRWSVNGPMILIEPYSGEAVVVKVRPISAKAADVIYPDGTIQQLRRCGN